MTYREIATTRRVKLAAAVRLVQRRKWRRQTGNDGTARILVPPDWAKPSDRAPPDIVHDVAQDGDSAVADDVTPDQHVLASALAALEDALTEANKRADTSEQGRIAMQALADRTMAQLADAGTRADEANRRADAADARSEANVQRADRAEARADQERLAGDRFRGEAEAARGELAQAVERQTAAETEARILREAENARQQLGRWRRAWRGWRGR
jgi:hypothetical protein